MNKQNRQLGKTYRFLDRYPYNVFRSGHDIESAAELALRNCLGKIPFINIESIQREPVQGGIQTDFLVRLSLPGSKKQNLVVEIKNNGQPRIARDAVNFLLRYRSIDPGSYGVFIAPYISLTASEICTKEGIGYLDLAGNCHLSFGQVYIDQQNKPNPFTITRTLRSLYSPKAARILRVLLTAPSKKTWKVKELADESGVSLGQVSNVKNLLDNREWIQSSLAGFTLTSPEQLLTEWAENYDYRKNLVRDFYSLKSIPEIEAELAEVFSQRGIMYALTGFSGAARLAPAVRYQRVMVYVHETQEDITSMLISA